MEEEQCMLVRVNSPCGLHEWKYRTILSHKPKIPYICMKQWTENFLVVTGVTNFLSTCMGCCGALHCFYLQCVFCTLFQIDIKLINIPSHTHTHIHTGSRTWAYTHQKSSKGIFSAPELVLGLVLLYVCSQRANFLIAAHSG